MRACVYDKWIRTCPIMHVQPIFPCFRMCLSEFIDMILVFVQSFQSDHFHHFDRHLCEHFPEFFGLEEMAESVTSSSIIIPCLYEFIEIRFVRYVFWPYCRPYQQYAVESYYGYKDGCAFFRYPDELLDRFLSLRCWMDMGKRSSETDDGVKGFVPVC